MEKSATVLWADRYRIFCLKKYLASKPESVCRNIVICELKSVSLRPVLVVNRATNARSFYDQLMNNE